MKAKLIRYSLLLITMVAVIGCATTTRVLIQTDTSEAKVYIDGDYIGDTKGENGNASIQVRATNKTSTFVKIEKGDRSITSIFLTELKPINLVGGILFVIPFVWLTGPIALQTINLF